ncbi:hypothetical protein Tco_1195639 [Tanacetum coccineum]
MGGIFSLEARDMDTKLLSALESNNTLARCSSLGIVVGGLSALICIMPFLSTGMASNYHGCRLLPVLALCSAVPLVNGPTFLQNITLNSARSCVMQSAFLTQGTVSSISIIFSWGGSISPEGFLSSVLLWLVIIVAVVGVTVVVVIIVAVESGTIEVTTRFANPGIFSNICLETFACHIRMVGQKNSTKIELLPSFKVTSSKLHLCSLRTVANRENTDSATLSCHKEFSLRQALVMAVVQMDDYPLGGIQSTLNNIVRRDENTSP